MEQLDAYACCGHSVVMGMKSAEWQDVSKVLSMFGGNASAAKRRYRSFVEKGIGIGRRPDLTGGGLIRSAGGWQSVQAYRKRKVHLKGDERILGDSDFVLHVLEGQNEKMKRQYRLREQGYDFEKVVERVSKLFSLSAQEILNPSRQRQRVSARSLLCYRAIRKLGITAAVLSQRLVMGQSSVSRAVGRGESLASDMKVSLLGF